MELELRSVEPQGAHEAGGAPEGGGRALNPHRQAVGPLALILSPKILINSKKCLRGSRTFRELFFSTHKTTSW